MITRENMIKNNFDKEGFSKKIVNFHFGKNYIDYFIIENLRKDIERNEHFLNFSKNKDELIQNIIREKSNIYKDFSALILMEFISTEIDLKNISLNFYYKDLLSVNQKHDFGKFIFNLEEEDINLLCETYDFEKIKKFISFIQENIIFKWHLQEQSRIFNDYYYKDELI